MNAWSAYFRHQEARMFGIAFRASPTGEHESDRRVTILAGDQSDCQFLAALARNFSGAAQLDIIIDDGSHVPSHQLRSLEALFFSALKPGGLYIVEDVETSYWDIPNAELYGYPFPGVGAHSTLSFVEHMTLLVDVLNQRFMVQKNQYRPDYYLISPKLDPHVESLTFAQNIIILRKKTTNQFDNSELMTHRSTGNAISQWLNSTIAQTLVGNARRSLCDR